MRFLLFLLLNFAALAVGGLFTGKGVPSAWYTRLNLAPWTPPGWVFGVAWTSIMLAFTVYMGRLWAQVADRKTLIVLFALQWVLNVLWNPLFFYFRLTVPALVDLVGLLVLLAGMLWYYRTEAGWYSVFLLPYVLWLVVAASLNGWIVVKN